MISLKKNHKFRVDNGKKHDDEYEEEYEEDEDEDEDDYEKGIEGFLDQKLQKNQWLHFKRMSVYLKKISQTKVAVSTIEVYEKFRRRGVATSFFVALDKVAKKKKFVVLVQEVHSEELRDLLRKLSYVPDNEKQEYWKKNEE